MKRLVVPFAVMVVALLTLCSATAQDKKKGRIDPARFKRVIKKIDPEIRAAQQSLQAAKKRLQKALNDEVLSEKGAVERHYLKAPVLGDRP